MRCAFRGVDFGDILGADVRAKHGCTTYDLLANIVHDGEPTKGTYRVHILHKVNSFYCWPIITINFTSQLLLLGDRKMVWNARSARDRNSSADDHSHRSLHSGRKRNTIKRYYVPFKMFKHFRYGNNLRKEATLKCPTEISVKSVKPELK